MTEKLLDGLLLLIVVAAIIVYGAFGATPLILAAVAALALFMLAALYYTLKV